MNARHCSATLPEHTEIVGFYRHANDNTPRAGIDRATLADFLAFDGDLANVTD